MEATSQGRVIRPFPGSGFGPLDWVSNLELVERAPPTDVLLIPLIIQDALAPQILQIHYKENWESRHPLVPKQRQL